MMSVASSTTPVIDWNSCRTPSMRTAVTAAPSIEDNRVRRRALPMVVPNPRSNGWALNLPYFSVSVSASWARRLGFWNPLQSMLNHLSHSAAKHFAVPVPLLPHRMIELSAMTCGGTTEDVHVGRAEALPCRLLRVQFDDQLLVDGQVDVIALRQREHFAAQRVRIDRQP